MSGSNVIAWIVMAPAWAVIGALAAWQLTELAGESWLVGAIFWLGWMALVGFPVRGYRAALRSTARRAGF